jgi:tartrate dehydrogenase/decarboxylase / D-malate dehydrogenase
MDSQIASGAKAQASRQFNVSAEAATHKDQLRDKFWWIKTEKTERRHHSMNTYKIAVIPGDGIGKEVVPEGLRVLEAAGKRFGIKYSFTHFDWSCETYVKTGKMMPDDGLAQLRPFDAIFLGAVGYPGVPDHISLWGLLIPIRRTFEQYVNLRPVRMLKGVESPLKNAKPGEIDFYVVRENVEGEYSNIGGRMYSGTDEEMAMQQTIFTRRGTDRIMRYAFDLARKRKSHVTSATKSNGIIHTMPYWDERFAAISKEYPDVRTDQFHIDILTAHFVRRPQMFDVVVGSNLFGDILSDLGPAVVGSIGIAAGANLNPPKKYPSMFEPVHGSAPDIAGKGIANPIGQIWSGAMMLAHFGETEAANAIERGIEEVLTKPEYLTPDVGGKATTQIVGKAIADALVK